MTDEIIKTIELKAPVDRVWRAITDHKAFGEWFRCTLAGPFELGQTVHAQMNVEGCENLGFESTVTDMTPQSLFAFDWRSSAPDRAHLPTTRVAFHLAAATDGTTLTIRESGFDALPADLRAERFRDNTDGWNFQADNLTAYVQS